MRYGFAALFLLTLSAAASAQEVSTRFTAPSLETLNGLLQTVQQQGAQARLSADDVLVRMMTFDRDRDGRVATGELSERMQGLVARGDRSGDGALDESEIRMLATARQFAATSPQGGGYGFLDTTFSSRNHIENSIDDLRLAPNARAEAKRIALAFVDEFEAGASANLRQALGPIITTQQLAQLEASLSTRGRAVLMTAGVNGAVAPAPVAPTRPAVTTALVRQRLSLSPEELKAVAAAADAFRAEQQFDDAHRIQLVARLSSVLTPEESDNLSAALARRPLIKRPGTVAGVVSAVQVREIGFTGTTAP